MRLIVPFTLCLTMLSACQPSDKPAAINETSDTPPAVVQKTTADMSESERLNAWFEVKYEEQLQMSPIDMTFLGRKDNYDQIDTMTEAEEKKQLAWKEATVKEMTSQFDYEKLESEAKTSYDIWIYQYEQARASQVFTRNGYIFTQFNGIQAFATQFLISFHKVESESDLTAYISRIGGISRAISELLDRAKLNAKDGTRPPRFAYEGVIEQATNLLTGAPFTDSGQDSPLWSNAKSKIAALAEQGIFDEERAEELRDQAKQALLNNYAPAYTELINWFKADIENTGKIAQGAGALPNGKAFYNHSLKVRTTTDLSAEEIHSIGLNEVERIYEEMEAIKNKVEFRGTLQEFFTWIQSNKNDERFYYPNTDEGRQGYLDDSQRYLDYIAQQLPNYFGILPKAGLVVKRVEAFREQDGAAQHYFSGTPDGSRPGVYYAHLSEMTAMPKNEMEAIAYHEGNPGHHMQISIAQELTSVPQFRTQAHFTAYSEGWGLYAELLAKEMGAYENDYTDFGRLVTEMWRAVRLVVDTGLHSKGWTEQQAIDYFKKNTPIEDEAVKSEVRRYLVLPGQATAYKVGMLKILELRAYAKQTLGDKFDIRAFHDTILGGGAMPLTILERRVKDWIARSM